MLLRFNHQFVILGDPATLTPQSLKEEEYKQLGWDIRRNLAKINYRIHTDDKGKVKRSRLSIQISTNEVMP
ncbi:MAG: hypothetical protein A2X82_00665 [Geobacteraceae bacterium GWC2_55_20]|nr:MAG: hypothetical protein A2X82_00665 [Geobacteraceae bacterium GWC2_55_20]OGU18775.1 MAG: hypothetical protein A2X85_08895 [Geobacteraceae bacterium GWF2_54_21]